MLIATYSLIAINVILYFMSNKNQEMIEEYKFSIGAILKDKEHYRWITAGFFHASAGHILFNMYSFHSFAKGIEKFYGPFTVCIIFILGIIAGNIGCMLINRKNYYYSALGASGGVTSIIYASILLMEEGSVYLFFIPVPIPDKIFAVAYVLVSYYLIGNKKDNIAHEAHLGGALIGLIIAIIIIPWVFFQKFQMILLILLPFIIIPVINKFFQNND